MTRLYIIKDEIDTLASDLLANISTEDTILLLQDGVLLCNTPASSTYACLEDVKARGIDRGHKTIGYKEMALLIKNHEKIIFL